MLEIVHSDEPEALRTGRSKSFRIPFGSAPSRRLPARVVDPFAAKLAVVRASEAEQDAALRMHRAEIESMVAMWRSGRQRLQHYESTLLPLARDRSRAVLTAYASARGNIIATLDALRDEVDLQREYVALEGDVTRAWVFLHLLHSTGVTP